MVMVCQIARMNDILLTHELEAIQLHSVLNT